MADHISRVNNTRNFYYPSFSSNRTDFEIDLDRPVFEEEENSFFPEDREANNPFEENPSSEDAVPIRNILATPQKTPTRAKPYVDKFRHLMSQPEFAQSRINRNNEDTLNGVIAKIDSETPSAAKPHIVRKLYSEILNTQTQEAGKKRRIEGDANQPAKRACIAVPQSTIEETIDGSWLNRLLVQLKHLHESSKQPGEKEIPWIINETHITEMGDKGFHLCTPQEKQRVKILLEDSSTGLWFGEFSNSKSKPKKSTFFPITWTFDDLLKALSNATILTQHQEENRGRIILSFPGCLFKTEALLSHGGTVTWSCYPLWYYAIFNEKAHYAILPGISYTAEEIKRAGRQASVNNHMYKLANGDKIIDVAATLPHNSPIDRGIYIIFSRDDLDNS